LKGRRDLYFLRKIAEKTCNCSLILDIGGQKFGVSAILNGVEVVHILSQEKVATNTMSILGSFLTSHAIYLLPPTDEQLYQQIIKEAMKAAVLSIGVPRADMEVLIGSMAEYQPDDVDMYLKKLKSI